MAEDVSVTYSALYTQRLALEVAARDVADAMDSAHSTDTGVQAPVGRTSLREMLEGALGETRAHVELGEHDVQVVMGRIRDIETQTEELDIRLGAGWEDLPL